MVETLHLMRIVYQQYALSNAPIKAFQDVRLYQISMCCVELRSDSTND